MTLTTEHIRIFLFFLLSTLNYNTKLTATTTPRHNQMSICFMFHICQHQPQPLKISQVKSFQKLLNKVIEIPGGLYLQLQTYC